MANHAQNAPAALIPVFTGQIAGLPAQLCSARDLYQFLQVGRDFSDWIKYRIEQYGFVEGEDFLRFGSTNLGNQKGRGGNRKTVIEYDLTLDMAKELAMVENNEQGRMARRYFIDCERQAQASALPEPSSPALPQPVQSRILLTLVNGVVVESRALADDEAIIDPATLDALRWDLVQDMTRTFGRIRDALIVDGAATRPAAQRRGRAK